MNRHLSVILPPPHPAQPVHLASPVSNSELGKHNPESHSLSLFRSWHPMQGGQQSHGVMCDLIGRTKQKRVPGHEKHAR